MNKTSLAILILVMLGQLLTACTGSPARQIAAYSRDKPIAQYPSQVSIVYHASIELQVADVDRAADRAARWAYDFGGYLASSQSWFVDGRKQTALELAVPTASFDRLRRELYSLGSLLNESISSEYDPNLTYPLHFSIIRVHLRPASAGLPPLQIGSWNPLRTIQDALGVFLAVFGFLADILIWIVIVGGPFVVIYLAVRVALRRLRRSSP